jgi:hypothetical protein
MNRRHLLALAGGALAAPLVGTARASVPAERLQALVAAYPDHLAGLEGDMLVWRDGVRSPTGAGLPERSFDEMLRQATIADQMRQAYPRGRPQGPPPRDHSPGRIRNTAFFTRIYGDCRAADFAARLVPVTWMPRTRAQRVMVSPVNDVAGRLARVIDDLEAMPDRFKAFLVPSAGTFNCRAVADTGLMSMHGFGTAIDIAVERSDYWAWGSRRGTVAYRNRIPYEIAEIFEAHGFIWGGKWYHFDTMHFEYRPELLA